MIDRKLYDVSLNCELELYKLDKYFGVNLIKNSGFVESVHFDIFDEVANVRMALFLWSPRIDRAVSFYLSFSEIEHGAAISAPESNELVRRLELGRNEYGRTFALTDKLSVSANYKHLILSDIRSPKGLCK